jgi:CII-binding regulator of phage lambda lysogenization HflD
MRRTEMRDTIEDLDKAIAILRKIQTNGKVDSSGLSQVIHSLSTMKNEAEATVEGQRRQNEEELKALVTRAGQTPNDETIL